MSINITLIITIVLFMFMMIQGYQKGFAKSVSDFIAMVVALIMLVVVALIYTSVRNGSSLSLVGLIVVLVFVGIVYNIVRFLLKSIESIMQLPGFRTVDHLLGLCIGGICAVAIVWIVFLLAQMGILGEIGIYIQTDVNGSEILSKLHECNYLKKLY